ncbi:3-oxoacyl-ACP reductase FabG [Desulfurivibrio dismutans]|uniref:3-oxoacyl-ACP reductase FabG n=1 Tax=Desulfurivibrio dismutans TaxID=1398908 RepID=UPI0023DA55A6|nr:3-oxoacyl-ACP reductase FabG [Desulfurivibrio alkaliphilus]MDF1614731.1 3-oxoacyl-ACP reductase FabG [Desulfurivibrio alkaliphilus]
MSDAPVVFISGASRGIGAGIARRLADSGYDLWLNYHSAHAEARALQAEIEEKGRRCRLLPFDVADEEAVGAALEPLLAEETPYGFVHNAGITRDTLLPMMSRQDWDRVLATHLTGFFLLGRLFSKAMLGKRKGRIVAVASVSGETGQAGQVNYAAAKGGMIAACKSLAREVARRNILVNVVSPGLIDTEMIKDLPLERILPMVPMGRVGTVEEVAGVVNFLLGPEAGYITGQVIGVNGGLYM